MKPTRHLCCLCLFLGLLLGLLLAPDARAWSLKAPGLLDRLWLFNTLSQKQEDPAWKPCGNLLDEADSALDREEYERAFKLLQDYEASTCTRKSVDHKVWAYLGYLYEFGEGTALNIDEAIKYYTKSAEAKNREAKFRLGQIYFVDKNDNQNALFWLEQAAAEGHPDACYWAGYIYHIEDSPLYSLEKAIKYYEMGSKKKSIECSYELGILYCYGDGVQEDLDKGLELLTFAAERGHADAASYISWILMDRYEHDAELLEEAYLWLETSKHFKSELNKDGELEQMILKEISPKSRAKVDKKLERFVSRIILRTQK